MEAGEGELVRFTLTHAATITAGSLTTSREGDVLVVRAPWTSGAPTEYPIAASADGCPSALATLAVTPMRVSSLTWPAGEGPEEREHPIFWIDPAAPDTLVVGSGYGFVPRQFTPLWDLWTRDLADDAAPWVQLETSRSSKLQGGLGGRVVDGPPGGELSFYVQGGEGPADTFLLAHDDEGWDMVAGDAPDNQLHAFVQIAASDYLMALGLVPDGDSYSFERDVYHFGVDGWAQVPLLDNTRPSLRYGFPYAWDAIGKRLLVVSGARSPTAADPVNAADDTWALNVDQDVSGKPTGAVWTKLETSGTTPELRNGCWAFDPDNRRLFVFGGTADGASAVPGLHVLELDGDNARWVDIDVDPTRTLPPSRSSCAGAWDQVRKRFVIGFGNAAALYRDLWFFAF